MRIALIFTAILSGCVLTPTYNMSKLQRDINEFNAKVEKIAAKAQTDFDEKRTLLSHLDRASPPAYNAVAPELKARFSRMEKSLADAAAARKIMREARADLASLGHGRENVRGGDAEFGAVESATKRFEGAAQSLNSLLQDYSKASNALAKTLAEKKLYYHFDVKEFQKRLHKAIKIAQKNVKTLDGAKRSEKMNELSVRYTALAQKLPELGARLNAAADGRARVASTDPQWPALKSVLNDFEALGSQLEILNEEIKKAR